MAGSFNIDVAIQFQQPGIHVVLETVGASLRALPLDDQIAIAVRLPLLVRPEIRVVKPESDGESNYGDLIEDENADLPEETTAVTMRSTELANALAALNPRMRLVIAKRFGLDGQAPQTLEQVGSELGITRERVRQLESRALRELRNQAPDLYLYLRTA